MYSSYSKMGGTMNRELKAQIIRKFGAQYLFARTLGIREASVSAVVQGRQRLDPDTRRKWAEALDAPAERLFPSEGNAHV